MDAVTRHVTDRELLSRLDEELSEGRRAAIDRHLAGCETCRGRSRAIGIAASDASSVFRSLAPAFPVESSRARLKRALEADASSIPAWSSGWWGSMRTAASHHALTAAIAVAAIALTASLIVGSAPGSADPETQPPQGALPIASFTPGATWEVSAGELCAGTRHTRPVDEATRMQVVSAYRMEHVPADQYELDYLVTPELGGATDARNLWPQLYASPVWNARVKDELERLLPELVCAGQLDLETAQRDIAVDWVAAYKKYFDTDRPLQAHRGPALEDDDDDVDVMLADLRPAPRVRLVSLAMGR